LRAAQRRQRDLLAVGRGRRAVVVFDGCVGVRVAGVDGDAEYRAAHAGVDGRGVVARGEGREALLSLRDDPADVSDRSWASVGKSYFSCPARPACKMSSARSRPVNKSSPSGKSQPIFSAAEVTSLSWNFFRPFDTDGMSEKMVLTSLKEFAICCQTLQITLACKSVLSRRKIRTDNSTHLGTIQSEQGKRLLCHLRNVPERQHLLRDRFCLRLKACSELHRAS